MSFPLSFADKHINHTCWMASCDKKDLPHQNNHHQEKDQNRGDKRNLPDQNQITCVKPDEVKNQ